MLFWPHTAVPRETDKPVHCHCGAVTFPNPRDLGQDISPHRVNCVSLYGLMDATITKSELKQI
jgi:hypothetical protein